jgi:hypothetical protein
LELHDDGVRGQERLTAYDRPFFGRGDNLLLGPLNPAEVGDARSLQAADAIDASPCLEGCQERCGARHPGGPVACGR